MNDPLPPAAISRLLAVKRYAEAQKAAERALAAEPESSNLMALLAESLLGSGQPDEARKVANRACGLDPGNPDRHLLMARIAWKQRDLFTARTACIEGIRLRPDAAGSHALLAQISAQLSPGHAESHNAAIHAVSLAPNSAHTHFAAGYAFAAAGKKKLARKAYQRALEIDPQHSAALNNLGTLKRTSTRATQDYRAALAMNPHSRAALRNLERIAHGFALRLWLTGAVIWFLGCVSTSVAAPGRTSHPNAFSVVVAIVLPWTFAVPVWLVARQLPSGVTRHLVRLTSSTPRRKVLTALALLMFVFGMAACLVPGVGSLGLNPLVFWPVAALGFVQVTSRAHRR